MGPAASAYQIDLLGAPLLVSWQITRNCDLACVHCCTESAPAKRLPDELDRAGAMRIADELIRAEVPYVMLCGGEPTLAPHFLELAEHLGNAGIHLKIETNGQRFDAALAERLATLPIRSIQVSLDADDQATYARQRAGGSLEKAHAACQAVRAAGLPLEVTFAPTRLNIQQVRNVIDRAVSLGAFRFNTGKLMRIGTAARHWARLDPQSYHEFLLVLRRQKHRLAGIMDLSYEPFSIGQALRGALLDPPATLLVLPNGLVKVVAALPYTCADLRHDTLAEAWDCYRSAWRDDTILRAVRNAITDESSHARANTWQPLNAVSISTPLEAL